VSKVPSSFHFNSIYYIFLNIIARPLVLESFWA
jgi:hypothetical protein